MLVMVISDLHYELHVRKGVDESVAWDWLLEVVEAHRPDLLLSCGDWGVAATPEAFDELLGRVKVLSIYGNHENMGVLQAVRNRDETPILLEDAQPVRVGGLTIAGLHGILSVSGRPKRGVPRRTPQELVYAAAGLAGKSVDVLLMHEGPYLPEYGEWGIVRVPLFHDAIDEALRLVRPRILFCGHLHATPYSMVRLPLGPLHVRVVSSQEHRHYATLDTRERRITVWRDGEEAAAARL